MDERIITMLLRLVHILAGIFWVGSVFLLTGFLLPTVRATGREGGRFMQHLMQQRRLPVFLAVGMGLTVLSGVTLYARMVSATHGAWAGTRPGIVYGLGGLSAILAGVVGGVINGPAAQRMASVGQRMSEAGAPTAEQQAEMQRLQARLVLGSRIVASLLLVAAAAMAVGRYV